MVSRAKSSDLVPLFAALADRTRLRLLNLIAGREVCVCYLVEILRQGQPKISRHLAPAANPNASSLFRACQFLPSLRGRLWSPGRLTGDPGITRLSLWIQTDRLPPLPGDCGRWALVLRSIVVHPGSCSGRFFRVWQRVGCVSIDVPTSEGDDVVALRAPAGKLPGELKRRVLCIHPARCVSMN